MQTKPVALAVLLLALQGSASAGDVSVSVGGSNSFNNNSGSINVTQSNTISNHDVAVEEKLNSLLGNAGNTIASPKATPQQKKEAAETIQFGSVAKEINTMQASMEQKNRLCQSKAKVLADVLGYNLGFFFGKCNEVFK